MAQIQAVLFDVYSTLIDLTTDEEDRRVYQFLSNWLSYQGFQVRPNELHQLFNRLVAEELASNPNDFPDIDIGNVFRRILVDIDERPSQTNEGELFHELALLFRILTTKRIAVVPETSMALRDLSQRVRVGVISNTQRLFTLPELKKFQLADCLECMVFSSDVLTSKPSPRIFQRGLQKLGIQPEEAVFVGDNLFDDIWGAQQIGMRTLWFDREHPDNLPDDIKRPKPDEQFRQGSRRNLVDILIAML